MANAEIISGLNKKLSYYKGRITFHKNRLENEELRSLGMLTTALNKVREIAGKATSALEELDALNVEMVEDRDSLESSICELEGKLLDAINEVELGIRGVVGGVGSHAGQVGGLDDVHVKTDQDVKRKIVIKLPEIQLPKFDGNELNWLNFQGRFMNMVHNDSSVDEVVKFHFLLSCVQDGKAMQLISSIPVCSEQYVNAWKTLCDHYNNILSIQKLHISLLYDIKKPVENSAPSLKSFVETAAKHYNALLALELKIDSFGNLLLMHVLMERLDGGSRVEVVKNSPRESVITFPEFKEILMKRVMVLESLKSTVVRSSAEIGKQSNNNASDKNNLKYTKHNRTFVSKALTCFYCDQGHVLTQCPKFTHSSVPPQQRFEFTKKSNLCVNCLTANHRSFECKSNACGLCGQKHHILLHFDQPVKSKANARVVDSESQNSTRSEPGTSGVSAKTKTGMDVKQSYSSSTVSDSHQVVLPTAVILVETAGGVNIPVRALLDSGAQSNFVTNKVCKMANFKKESVSVPISGISQEVNIVKSQVEIKIKSKFTNYQNQFKFLVLPKISGYLPCRYINIDLNDITDDKKLADPAFYEPHEIDLLLGAEVFNEILIGNRVVLSKELPAFYATEFGLVISGRIGRETCDSHSMKTYFCMSCDSWVNDKLKKFFELDKVTNLSKFSREESMCMEHFDQNVGRTESGRYQVALPVTKKIADLQDSSHRALKQYKWLERRLDRNPNVKQLYDQFMLEYQLLGHMEEVVDLESTSQYGKSYYLPHHYVLKEASTTTKLRVVFNASSPSTSGVSLNDCLLVGPTVQQNMVEIALRFRKHPVAFTGDLAKMYRQILMEKDDRDLQRIWWRNDKNELACFRLCTITYGTGSAPFLATQTLNKLAEDERERLPLASKVLRRDFYVDDVLTGSDTFEEATALKEQLIELLASGGFELRKIHSNNEKLVDDDPMNSGVPSVLGLLWDTKQDRLIISFPKYELSDKCSKRSVLSELAQFYDPIGICSPVIFTSKLFLRSLWIDKKLDWDTQLNVSSTEYWLEFKKQLAKVSKCEISRCVVSYQYKRIEAHGFGDASSVGYGCVIYIRTVDYADNVNVNIVCSKSRVAPLKVQTIPRLELCAALLVAQLMKKVVDAMEIKFDQVWLWSDSELTLLRLHKNPSEFVTFVANRLAQIHELSNKNDWRYVPTDKNPADIVSRGIMPEELPHCKLWWSGPEFLSQPNESFPEAPKLAIKPELLELAKPAKTFVAKRAEELIPTFELVERFSDFNRLIRILCYVFRFINNGLNRVGHGNELNKNHKIDVSEFEDTLKRLVRNIQVVEFDDEVKQIKRLGHVSNSSCLKSLCPFLDESGLLRVGGRLKNADITYDQQHQMLLPSHHVLSRLITEHEHREQLHAGPQAMLYQIRMKFWIIHGRNLCRSVVNSCVRCATLKPKTVNQIMGQLPADRVTPSRPFVVTGIDLCGPFFLSIKLKSRIVMKSYIVVFVCFSTKAVHLELVGDQSTKSFLAALRRFVGRRGYCEKIYSDNGSNFIGAKRELNDLYLLFESEVHKQEVDKFCLSKKIQWINIPPYSPHHGGLWEAAVKSGKHHLRRVIGKTTYTYEELNTLTIQVEACLNSRPLTPMSSDPNDLSCLTPGHFLIGQPLSALAEPSLQHLDFNRLDRFQRLQHMLQTFWQRWSKEYLGTLQQRNKWVVEQTELKVGLLVLLIEDGVSPLNWPRGRIVDVIRGGDGRVRVVVVKTAASMVRRAITKIAILPMRPNE